MASKDHLQIPIEYKLIKEEGKWKILSIRLLKHKNIPNSKEAGNDENLIEIAKGQLQDIQSQKFIEAYQNYSSQEFKKATSEQAFFGFIKRYPIFSYYHVVSFHKPTIRNGIGTLSVILQSDQIAAYVKYYFIYENQKWKVWSMQVLSPAEQQRPLSSLDDRECRKTMGLESTLLGDGVNEHGQIEQPKTSFSSNLKELYVNIEISHGTKGNTVCLDLQHTESGSSILAKADIEENGDTMLMSVFSPPATGWPKGHYQLIIKTSAGFIKTIDFEIK